MRFSRSQGSSANKVHVVWRDIGFGEIAVEAGISESHADVSLKDYTYTQRRWIAYTSFYIERQDGPFIQYLGGIGTLVLRREAQHLLSSVALPARAERIYRFAEKVWM
jgi:hypothetical protein